MKGFFKSLQKDSVLNGSFWATIVVALITVGMIFLSYNSLPPFVPLYNHMPWGYARLGKTYELFLLPVLVLIICIFNTIFGIRLLEKSPLLARFLFITMVSLAIFTAIFTGRLILITL